MDIDNDKLPMNILTKKLVAAAERGEGVTLTPEETKLIADDLSEWVSIPVYDFQKQG